MSSLSRALLLAAALVAALLLSALVLQSWLRRQAWETHAATTAAFGDRLSAAHALDPRPPERCDDDYLRRLATLLDAEVRVVPADAPAPEKPFHVYAAISIGDGTSRLEASQTSPALLAQQNNQRRVFAATLLLALVLGSLPVGLSLLAGRRVNSDTRTPWRADAAGLERFARLTVERGDALAREQNARTRAEEDLHVSRSLLERSLEERVRLGRELHDNVSQTLYAVTLTLESVRKKTTSSPEIDERFEKCIAELRRLNQETRAFLRELEPASVQRAPLAQALTDALASVVASPDVIVEQRLEDDALLLIPAKHTVDLVNIVREAVSNAVRHGRARRISVRAACDGHMIALAIVDDGVGFAPSAPSSGHGLGNMRARTAALGASLQIDSTPGKGTRVLLTLPVDSPPA